MSACELAAGRQIEWLLSPELARRAFRSWWPSHYVVPSNEVARRRWGPAALMEERGAKRANARIEAPECGTATRHNVLRGRKRWDHLRGKT